MRYSARKPFRWLCCMVLAALAMTSCDMMEQDLSDCPYGLYVTFKYDYNLQRADMFNDHVGSVKLYVFDEQNKLVKTVEESRRAEQACKDRGREQCRRRGAAETAGIRDAHHRPCPRPLPLRSPGRSAALRRYDGDQSRQVCAHGHRHGRRHYRPLSAAGPPRDGRRHV